MAVSTKSRHFYSSVVFLLAITAGAAPEDSLRRPTRVPGSPHLVTENEFPYLFWQPSPRPYTPQPPSTARQEPTAYPFFYGENVGDTISDTTPWQALPIQLPDDLVGAFDERTTHSTTTQTPAYPTPASPQYGRHPGVTERPHLFFPERLYTSSRNQVIRRGQGLGDQNAASSQLGHRYSNYGNTAPLSEDNPYEINYDTRPSSATPWRHSVINQPKVPRPSKVPSIASWPFRPNRNRQNDLPQRLNSQKRWRDTNYMASGEVPSASSGNSILSSADFDYESVGNEDYYDYVYDDYHDYEYSDEKQHATLKHPSSDYRLPGEIKWQTAGERRPSGAKVPAQVSHSRPNGGQMHSVIHQQDDNYKYYMRPQEYTGSQQNNPPRGKRPETQQLLHVRPQRRPRPRPRPSRPKDPNNIDRITGIDTSSVLVPGGMLIVAVAVALFYFNFIWYPTPVVTARLIQMISNSASHDFLDDSERVAVERMYEVFRSLETEYTQEPDLWTPACKSRFVCQVHHELPGLWQVTQTIAAIVRSTLATGPQGTNSFAVFLEAARLGAEDANCSHHYSSCRVEQIPLGASLQMALNATLESVTEVVYS